MESAGSDERVSPMEPICLQKGLVKLARRLEDLQPHEARFEFNHESLKMKLNGATGSTNVKIFCDGGDDDADEIDEEIFMANIEQLASVLRGAPSIRSQAFLSPPQSRGNHQA